MTDQGRADPNRCETIDYVIQCRQPDRTWKNDSPFMDDRTFAHQALEQQRERLPGFAFRVGRRTTTVAVEPDPVMCICTDDAWPPHCPCRSADI